MDRDFPQLNSLMHFDSAGEARVLGLMPSDDVCQLAIDEEGRGGRGLCPAQC